MMNDEQRRKWMQFMAKTFSEILAKNFADDPELYGFKQAFSSRIRTCPDCQNHDLCQLTKFLHRTEPYNYSVWGCAECGATFMYAISKETHEEWPPKAMDFAPRLLTFSNWIDHQN